MKTSYFINFVAFAVLGTAAQAQPGPVTVTANPERVCYDERQPAYLNFDLIIRNGTDKEVKVRELRALVLNPKGELIERRVLGLGARGVAAGDEWLLFNQFHFNSVKPGARIRYEVELEGGGADTPSVIVMPQSCITRTRLILPLAGRLLVTDGYDLLSHHRRSGYLDPESKKLGLTDNFQRFAIDFVTVDASGRQFSGDGGRNENWFTWGKPVRAAGDGTVAAVHDGQPDNDTVGSENRWVQRSLSDNEMTTYGNYVLIDHGGGEFSLVAHLRAGSVRVRKGDRVKAGDIVAQAGNSGSSLGPHIHYELRNGWGIRGIRNMPPYFRDLTVLGTGERDKDKGVAVNTGDIIITR